MKLIPTIICGGAGSRLWPASREQHPKPFIRLSDNESLLQKAFHRGAVLPEVVEILTVTNRDLFFQTEDDYSEVNKEGLPTSFILEPFGRNTAPAIAAAAFHTANVHGNDATLLVLPADHLIADFSSFANAVADAMILARDGKLVTFGIKPDAPETGYGYIEADGNKVVRFIEKPSREKAEAYIAEGGYLWNAGMFCFTAGAILRELERCCPEVLTTVRACIEQSRVANGNGVTQVELKAELFERVPDISIDYAVMERSDEIAVIPCDIGWSDIGSWDVLGSLTETDNNGNRIQGEALLSDVSKSYIQSNNRLVAAVGVSNLLIIDTPDALLVADRSRAQDVKHVYNRLKEQGHPAYKFHSMVHRPWGTYTVLEDSSRFKIKRIEVKPGASLSLQLHHHRSEHWIVVSGMAKVVNGDRELLVNTNESTYIPAGHKHRLENPGILNLVMIEVQCGDYLGEDDIKRFEDIYGRA